MHASFSSAALRRFFVLQPAILAISAMTPVGTIIMPVFDFSFFLVEKHGLNPLVHRTILNGAPPIHRGENAN